MSATLLWAWCRNVLLATCEPTRYEAVDGGFFSAAGDGHSMCSGRELAATRVDAVPDQALRNEIVTARHGREESESSRTVVYTGIQTRTEWRHHVDAEHKKTILFRITFQTIIFFDERLM